jgi:uncharacterized membrane protein
MQHAATRLLLFVLSAVALSGCAVVGGVFKAGMAAGILMVVVVVVLLMMLFRRRR